MKAKLIVVYVCFLGLIGSSVMASNELSNDLNTVQLKLERVQKINNLEKDNANFKNRINYLSKQLTDTTYQLKKANQNIKSASINIASLQSNNNTLRELKAQLEKKSIKNELAVREANNTNLITSQTTDKESFDQLLDKYSSNKKNMESQITELDSKIDIKNKTVRDLNSQIISYKDSVNSLNVTVALFSEQKKQLENQLTTTQQNTILEYKKEIEVINQKTEARVNKIKHNYDKLVAANNEKTLQAKEDYEKYLRSEKAAFSEQLKDVIANINNYQKNLLSTANSLTANADVLGNAASTLRKAYQKEGNPFPKKSYLGKMLTASGLEKTNPTWDMITAQINNIRDNTIQVRAVSDNLSASKLNSEEIINANKAKGGWFFGPFS